jgi:hypothetical protein
VDVQHQRQHDPSLWQNQNQNQPAHKLNNANNSNSSNIKMKEGLGPALKQGNNNLQSSISSSTLNVNNANKGNNNQTSSLNGTVDTSAKSSRFGILHGSYMRSKSATNDNTDTAGNAAASAAAGPTGAGAGRSQVLPRANVGNDTPNQRRETFPLTKPRPVLSAPSGNSSVGISSLLSSLSGIGARRSSSGGSSGGGSGSGTISVAETSLCNPTDAQVAAHARAGKGKY